jgi:hypothetical protein
MANKKPLVVASGKPQQLQDTDSLLANTVVISEPTNAPMTITSTTVVTNLNADMVDGFHASQFNGIRSLTNDNAGSIVIGTPVYVKSNGAVDKARANALSTCTTLGIVRDTSISAAAAGNIQFFGIVTATTGQWDAVTGGSGGLTPGTYYYVSAATAGQLTSTAPATVGQVVKEAIWAFSTTEALIVHTYAILL